MVDIAIMTMDAAADDDDDDDETATSTATMISIVVVRLPVDGILFGGRSAPCLFYQQHIIGEPNMRCQRPVPPGLCGLLPAVGAAERAAPGWRRAGPSGG